MHRDNTLRLHGKCLLVPLALGHLLNPVVVEDDHLQDVRSHQLEGDEVRDLDLVSNGEGGPTLIKGEPDVDRPDRDPLDAAGVHPKYEFRWDGDQVLGEVKGHRQAFQLGCKDDLAEVT